MRPRACHSCAQACFTNCRLASGRRCIPLLQCAQASVMLGSLQHVAAQCGLPNQARAHPAPRAGSAARSRAARAGSPRSHLAPPAAPAVRSPARACACCWLTAGCSGRRSAEARMPSVDGEATEGRGTSKRASAASAGSSGLPDRRSSDRLWNAHSASTEAQSASLLLPRFRDCSAAKPGRAARACVSGQLWTCYSAEFTYSTEQHAPRWHT